jgi:hypothetical protein
MAEQQVDYDKLAAQHGGTPVDYDAIAADVSKPPPSAPPKDTAKGLGAQFIDQAKANVQQGADLAVGAAKGVGNTVFGLGKVVRDYTPVGRISDAILPGVFEERPDALRPSNTAQQVGYTAEQIGEFFIPGGAAGKLGKAAEIAKSAALTGVQGGGAASMSASAALSAIPGGGAAKAAKGLRSSAIASETRALGPTKEWAKTEAAKLAPQMLERGVRGSRPAMLERAEAASKEAGQRLGAAYKAAAEAGQTINGQVIRGELQFAKDGLMVANAEGRMIPIAGAEGVLKKLDKLETFVAQLGDDIPVDKAHKVKTMWDRIVAKAGLYGPKAASNATDAESAWAIREGAGSFRQLLADVPDVAALNKEFGFWKGLRDVLRETEKRTQGQMGGGGLPGAMASVAGAATGFASGGLMEAFVGQQAAQRFVQVVRSPYWQSSVSAPLKDRMARALAAGDRGMATSTLDRIMAALPSQARQAFAQ